MKAVLQNFKTGDMAIEDVPPPSLKADGVLVLNVASLVSAGTEKAVIELAKMNPLQKARARPDLVKKVLNKAGQDGMLATARIVMNLVSAPLPLGYSSAGVVTRVGSRVADIAPGQRVACAGLGYANHAEVIYVPRNLLVPIPEGVSDAEAAFVTVGAIAMHGVRQANLTLGETVVVVGMGLVGQITAQICIASGCRVFCVDIDPSKVELAKTLGADGGLAASDRDVTAAVKAFTGGRGADAVLIAAGTKSNGPITLAPALLRDRGRVVAVGDIGHDLPRRAYFEKEIDLRQSRSYGPGRYDPGYEEKGNDYPIGYVRWTENRNMESFLELLAQGRIKLMPLLTHRYPIEDAEQAYSHLTGASGEPYIGILLEYELDKPQESIVRLAGAISKVPASDDVCLGVIGAGQFAQGVLLPALKKVPGVCFHGFATGSGLTSVNVARKYGASVCTSDYKELLADPAVTAVLIATRHDSHAGMVIDALKAGKHCFVEKPLALNDTELDAVIAAHDASPGTLLTGFNRRFSPLARRLRDAIGGKPLVMQYRINAGFIPGSHWHQDIESGGGRIVGEVCHFIDLMQFICGALPVSVSANALNDSNAPSDPDNLVMALNFADGSVGTITYAACGDSGFPKERIEVFGGGRVGVIDSWRSLLVQGNGRRIRQRCWLQAEKGFDQEMQAFVAAVRGGEPAIPFASQVATTRATFAIQKALRTSGTVKLSC
ncbi:MAG: bi-domain-containing oxidoreductase [Sulfuritalea sp.]|nr:bi-domain-containing oxidoreductase [Sulfuritalea sp.]